MVESGPVNNDGSLDTECVAVWMDDKQVLAFTLDLDWPHIANAKPCITGLKATLPSMVKLLAAQ